MQIKSPQYDLAIIKLKPILDNLPPRIIGIDGRYGAGKTTLGRYLAWSFNISLIETDLFLIGNTGIPVYETEIIQHIIDGRINDSLPVIIEGIALLSLIDELKRKLDFHIWVMNEKSNESESLDKFVIDYEQSFKPKDRADLPLYLSY